MENTDKSNRRGRPRSFNLEEVAGQAALLFWEHGYEGVTVDELTDAMGITTQKFYAAFGSKQKLYAQALEWYQREIVRPVRDALSTIDVVEAIQNALQVSALEFTRSGRPPGCMRSFAGITASKGNQDVSQLGTQMRRATTAAIAGRLEQGKREGQINEQCNTAVLANFLNAALVGMAMAAHDGASTDDLLAMAQLAVKVVGAEVREPNRCGLNHDSASG